MEYSEIIQRAIAAGQKALEEKGIPLEKPGETGSEEPSEASPDAYRQAAADCARELLGLKAEATKQRVALSLKHAMEQADLHDALSRERFLHVVIETLAQDIPEVSLAKILESRGIMEADYAKKNMKLLTTNEQYLMGSIALVLRKHQIQETEAMQEPAVSDVADVPKQNEAGVMEAFVSMHDVELEQNPDFQKARAAAMEEFKRQLEADGITPEYWRLKNLWDVVKEQVIKELGL